jgi:hypothetical protein
MTRELPRRSQGVQDSCSLDALSSGEEERIADRCGWDALTLTLTVVPAGRKRPVCIVLAVFQRRMSACFSSFGFVVLSWPWHQQRWRIAPLQPTKRNSITPFGKKLIAESGRARPTTNHSPRGNPSFDGLAASGFLPKDRIFTDYFSELEGSVVAAFTPPSSKLLHAARASTSTISVATRCFVA